MWATMWRGQRVAVIVPAFHEERWIELTVRGIPDFVDLVVVVDDASRDDTMGRAARCGSVRLVRVRHACNRGVGAAIVTGYHHALRLDAEVLVVMAGDAQMRPHDLPALLDAVVVDGADYAKGNRLVHPTARNMPRLRRWGTRSLALLTRWCTGLDIGDSQCGFTALRASAAIDLPLSELWPRYGYPNDLLALLAHHGASVVDVPVAAVYAGAKSGLHAGHLLSIASRIVRRAWSLRQAAPRLPAETSTERRRRLQHLA